MNIGGYIPLEEIEMFRVAYLVKGEYVKFIKLCFLFNKYINHETYTSVSILWTLGAWKRKEKEERGRNTEGEGEEKVQGGKKHRETGEKQGKEELT